MVTRVLGTETEFGIATRHAGTADPVSDSLLLISHYPDQALAKVLWDYENENPLLDARGFEVEGERERPGPEYNRLLNKVLFNGGRLYVDGAHPEYSTPECTNARDIVAYEAAGNRIVQFCQERASQLKGPGSFLLYKNNTDGKGNSYGYHENYLVSRRVPFERLMAILTPFFVTRQIYSGAGKVGAENRMPQVPYQMSQRADFFETLVDLNTMVKRPIINTRDEPHSDPVRFRRLHVIVGDANLSEFSTYLKVGTTAIVLTLIEEDADDGMASLSLEDPVSAIKEVSRDLDLQGRIKLKDGRALTAVQIQEEYLEAAHRYFARHELDPQTKDILVKWEYVLRQLKEDPMSLNREVDWVIKRNLLLAYQENKKCDWSDPRISMMDLQYHDIRPDKGLYFALEKNGRVERITTDEQINRCLLAAPLDTRAYFRAMCLKKFPEQVYGSSWTSVMFDIGNTTIKRIPLMDPSRGTELLTKGLFESSGSAEELLSRLTT
jgi:proteasome accessory factor PafA2